MLNPFKTGDVVYHAQHGKSEVVALEASSYSTHPVCLKGFGWVVPELLSFSAWSKPDWERPKPAFVPVLLAGMRVLARGTDNDLATFYIVVKSESEAFVTSVGGGLYLKGAYTFHRIDEEPVKFN